ncbi:serine/threonine-protein kinase [Mycolicibacter senuensis]|uniref:non-specific serine/threonine protein kinase n=1 Tax=Mycolicibacter senuensis TaxID=386913 RepID=A0A7I9XQ86_9MYCO|nr:serine/threonine-protein kinase [Mycolicibacter senuensis]GFG72155.1 hypothetical protein MSEN_38750 [Mycolicibacter senuensis]
MLTAGSTFAGYRIVRQLGSGGMGEVYLADHPRLPRRDALKVLPGQVSADPNFRERFNREADLAASLWHPHIVGVHDRGEYDGQLWIAMDYVDGSDADALLQHHPGGLPRKQVVEIIAAVAQALDYAHQRGLLHRDVKPANILLTKPGESSDRIILADFGIGLRVDEVSGLTATNMAVGTLRYAAPEQLRGEAIDHRADQYALAATAYHLLTGKPPVHPDPARLDAALARALAENPAERYASCAEFAAALQTTAPVSLPFSLPTPRRRVSKGWGFSAAALLGLYLLGNTSHPQPPAPAAAPAPPTTTTSTTTVTAPPPPQALQPPATTTPASTPTPTRPGPDRDARGPSARLRAGRYRRYPGRYGDRRATRLDRLPGALPARRLRGRSSPDRRIPRQHRAGVPSRRLHHPRLHALRHLRRRGRPERVVHLHRRRPVWPRRR